MGEEFRISIDEFEGHPFVSMRIWAPVMGGPMGPVRGKTMSVRVRELDDVIEALSEARSILEGDGARREQQQQQPRRGQRPDSGPAHPPARQPSTDFDEFGDR